MNQAELIQRLLAADQQAQAIAQDAKRAQETLEDSVAAEIAAREKAYQAQADDALSRLARQEREKSAAQLSALDKKLEEKLSQVETLYAARKDEWVDSIVQRIVGKAGE